MNHIYDKELEKVFLWTLVDLKRKKIENTVPGMVLYHKNRLKLQDVDKKEGQWCPDGVCHVIEVSK